ncbi:MAG: 5-formyltetrahydrofolate cyclo-ligase [Pseudomonadota bacterium]
MQDLKTTARRAAFARRKRARAAASADPTAPLLAHIRAQRPTCVSGYMPIRTEIDPLPAMAALAAGGLPVCVPVIAAAASPLRFARWTQQTRMVPGDFGALVPEAPDWVEPDLLIVPLLAFDRAGYRLGYGGGFYDRTLERLRTLRPTRAVGLAFAAQEVALVPREATDQLLDALVTERGLVPLAPGQ